MIQNNARLLRKHKDALSTRRRVLFALEALEGRYLLSADFGPQLLSTDPDFGLSSAAHAWAPDTPTPEAGASGEYLGGGVPDHVGEFEFRNGHWVFPGETDEMVREDRRYWDARAEATATGQGEFLAGELVALPDTFLLHSNPTASKTIYLDFDGFVATGTSWNSSYGDPIVSPAYNIEGDSGSFTTNELNRIQRIWHRVAEDFAPFDVDVTTEDPGEAALVKSGGSDTEWGIRVVITVDNFAACGCGGFAYINSFNWNYQSSGASDTPVYVFNTSEIGVSAAASHEVGHALGLSHDGTTASNPVQPSATYYNGHGSGETDWGPIMGSGYYSNVTTWDLGEYYGSNNGSSSANYSKGPNDIGIISTLNGFTFRPDDHGGTPAAATMVGYVGDNVSNPALVDVALYGIVGDRNDIDFIAFETGAGTVNLTINSYFGKAFISNGDGTYDTMLEGTSYSTTWQNNQGSNLDVLAKLYNSDGMLLATSNPTGLSASFTNVNLASGTYYISIDGTGYGDPFSSTSPTGYTDYASVGQYYVTGTVVRPLAAPTAGDDQYSVSEDDVLTIAAPGVLANDFDSNSNPLTAVLVAGPSHGTLGLNANGSFSYTPSPNYFGADSFTYKASDGTSDSNVATVSLTVTGVNDAPTGNADTYTAIKNTTLSVSAANGLLVNDQDIDGDSLTALIETNPAHGTLTLNSSGSFTYTPVTDYLGPDSFTYRVSDGPLSSAPVSVSLTVIPVPGITVGAVSGNTTEVGGSATFTLVLDTPISAPVTIGLSSSDTTEGTVSPASVTFSTADWSTPQTVTVTGVDDFIDDGNVSYTIVTAAAVSSDSNYNNLNAADVTLSNEDNDDPVTNDYQADSGELTLSGNYSTPPAVTGGSGNSEVGSAGVMSITEGLLILPAKFYPTADIAGDAIVTGTYLDTLAKDGTSEVLSERSSGGKPSSRYTYLSHTWQFGTISANTLHMTVTLSGGESETYRFEYSVNGGSTWTTAGTISSSGTHSFPAVVNGGSVQLRVSDTTRTAGQTGIDSLSIDELYFEGAGQTTSAIESYYAWTFTGLDTVQTFHLSGGEVDNFDDFQFQLSVDGGASWSNLGVLSGASDTIDVTFEAPITAASALVRVFDTDRTPGENTLGTVTVNAMYFRSIQSDLRTPVEVAVTSGPAKESSQVPAVVTFSRPADGDLSQPLTVHFAISGTASAGDYTQDPSGSTVTIPAGSAIGTVTFTPVDDALVEGTETIVVTLLDQDTYAFRPGFVGSVETEIQDDDLTVYVPISETTLAGSVTSGNYVSLGNKTTGTETVSEQESGGKPSNRYTYLEHIWNFGAVDNVQSFTGIVNSVSDVSADNYKLEYSINGGTNWIQLGANLVPNISSPVTIEVNFGSAIQTQQLQVRLIDTNRVSGERTIGTVTLAYLGFSTLPTGAGGASASGSSDGETSSASQSDSRVTQQLSQDAFYVFTGLDMAPTSGVASKDLTSDSNSVQVTTLDEDWTADPKSFDDYFSTWEPMDGSNLSEEEVAEPTDALSGDLDDDLLTILADAWI